MRIEDIYTKREYKCKKCNSGIYYGKVMKDDGTYYTKDGQPPNGKFGKESNVLSCQVDALNKDQIHKCNYKFVMDEIEKLDKGDFSQQQLVTSKPEMPQIHFTVTGIDQKVIDRIVKESEERAVLKIAQLKGVITACVNTGITNPAQIGMIFNAIDREGKNEG